MTTLTFPPFTEDEHDFIADFQASDAEAAGMTPVEIAQRLGAEGMPAFQRWTKHGLEAWRAKQSAAKGATKAPPAAPAAPEPEPELPAAPKAAQLPTAPKQAQLPADPESLPYLTADGVVDGLDELDASDYAIPYLGLKQPMTKNADQVPDGSFFLTGDEDGHSATRKVVFLEIHKERRASLGYSKKARAADLKRLNLDDGSVGEKVQVICSSRDLATPDARQDGIKPQHGDCRSCPEKEWKNGEKPLCLQVYKGVLVDLGADGTEQSPARFTFDGKAVREVKKLNTKLGSAARRHRLPIAGLVVELSSTYHENDEGKWWTPSFGMPRPGVSEEDMAYFRSLRHEAAAHEKRDRAEGAA